MNQKQTAFRRNWPALSMACGLALLVLWTMLLAFGIASFVNWLLQASVALEKRAKALRASFENPCWSD